MAGQAKIELLLELNNKVKAGLNQAKLDVYKDVNQMQRKMNSFKYDMVRHTNQIATEIPVIGSAMKLIKNPLTIATAGVIALGKGINYTTQKAADFNSEFRNLSNLNVDKSNADISALRRSVLDTAYNKGFDPTKAAIGFFDVQSITGKFGREVSAIVGKQGEFANLMKADFNNYVSGTALAMTNYGFGAKELDDYNKSSYATMKVGKTSFDELAKVQAVFAGSSASNKQTYDTANKMFTLFTTKTKSIDEAATLTKSLFNDLTKKATIDAFKKIGISMYDTSGKIKQADKLLFELNNKFKGLDKDNKIVTLKNQFTGSDGLIQMIQAATDKTGKLQSVFDDFESTKLSMDRVMELSKNDLNYQTSILENKLKVMEIEVGSAMLPLKLKMASLKLDFLEMANFFSSFNEYDRKKGGAQAYEMYSEYLNNVSTWTKAELDSKLLELKSEKDSLLKTGQGMYFPGDNDFFRITGSIATFRDNLFSWLPWAKKPRYNSVTDFLDNTKGKDFLYGKATQLNNLIPLLSEAWKTTTNNGTNIKPKPTMSTNGNANGTSSSDLASGLDSVVGSARQVRNITVNIDAFNKGGINTQNTSLQHMQPSQIEDWFTEMCMRVVRGLETSY